MKLLRKISIAIAGTILLMHSVLPHEHHTELNDNQNIQAHERATSLLDFIKLAFHIDLGQDHLEKYKAASQEQVTFDSYVSEIPDFSLETVYFENESQKFLAYKNNLYSKYYSRHHSLRGPPYMA